jgi:hypothetical protein
VLVPGLEREQGPVLALALERVPVRGQATV